SYNLTLTNQKIFNATQSNLFFKVMCSIGIFAALENLCILIILCSTKRLMKTSSLLIGLTIGHFLNGIMHTVNFWPGRGFPIQNVTTFHCVTITWTNIYVSIYQFLPLVLALIGLERLLALATPFWYRVECTNNRLWKLTGTTFIFVTISMACNL